MGRTLEFLRSPVAAISLGLAGTAFMAVGWVVAALLGCEERLVARGWAFGYEISPPECLPVATVVQAGCCGLGIAVILGLYIFFSGRREALRG